MKKWPQLVPGWSEVHPATRAICQKCEAEFDWDPGDGDPYDRCIKHGNATAGECGGQIVMKYDAGQQCRGCGKLDYSFPDPLNGCCSRVCMLQAEYAAQLQERAS